MKKLSVSIGFLLITWNTIAQSAIKDDAITHQEERMVFKQWDQNKFDPKSGFLSLNPYYWLVWGLFYPSYHKTDLRPLGPSGPQTQRLALVAAQNTADIQYKLQSDTIQHTALSEIANQSGLLSSADPLWLLYYQHQFDPLLSYTAAAALGTLPPQVSAALVSDGTYTWYSHQLDMLRERLNGARAADLDRGSRIMAYYRLLKEFRELLGIWAIRTASAQKTLDMTRQVQQVGQTKITVSDWTPQHDRTIASQVLQNRKY